MKIKNFVPVLLVLTILAACTPVITSPPQTPTVTIPPRADNFSFIFQDYSCGSIPVNVLDTASGTLVYTPLGDSTSTTINLRLTDNELETVYRKAMSIGFFDYPSEFVVPDDQALGFHAPSSSYQLSMTNGEMTNLVSWRDDTMTEPDYLKADQLRELLDLIDKIIQSHPEVQQLPEPKALCL
jgi:hypothetical protein